MMNTPHEPSRSITSRVARKLLPYRARRELRFQTSRPVVSFTFDDFPRSAIYNGSDILEKQGWHATFYVAASLMEIDNHHGPHFRAQDIHDLHARGHEIAGHTYAHVDCEHLGTQQTLLEIDHNKAALEALGHTAPLEHFAYPYGTTNVDLKRELQTRFKTLRGIAPHVHVGKADLNGLYSAPIFSGEKLEHTLRLIHGLKTRPGWLTLFAHDICETPSEWGCTSKDFLRVVQAVQQSGALVLPIGQALIHLEAHLETHHG
ncbi:MAG: hypothetical protein COA69_00980 [Robiginitomaculum sp.]|nr:MAG: hypothetical protein COA69_00980 [Robiginitomaculum sp.]